MHDMDLKKVELSPSICAILQLACKGITNNRERTTALVEYHAIVEACKQHTLENLPKEAWGQGDGGDSQVASANARVWSDRRVCYGQVDVQVTPDDDVPETPLAVINTPEVEARAHDLRHRSRESLLWGQQRFVNFYTSYRVKPRLMLPGDNGYLLALSDPSKKLEARKCVVVQKGQVKTGFVAVGRYPCHTIRDIEVWEAVEPDAELRAVII